jgi:hypothetical protein
MFKLLQRLIVALLVFSLAFSACTSDSTKTYVEPTPFKTAKEYDSKVVQDWQTMLCDVERYAEFYRPCPAARMMGYTGLAVYEATVNQLRVATVR